MILLSQMIKEVAKESLSHENMESAAKKLRRKFEKLIRVCGGDIEKMKDGKKCISFPDEEKEFIDIGSDGRDDLGNRHRFPSGRGLGYGERKVGIL